MIIYNPGIKPKNKHMQSILASSKLRLLRLKNNNPVTHNSKEVILKTSEAQLQGFYSENKNSKKLYILMHGWEGSAQSTYIQLLANTLYRKEKASIFRLNFRDHGDTHHLNKELFHSCRLNEVVESIQQICEKYPHKNIYMCGFSLGANFCLRVAAKLNNGIFSIKKVFAISPPINPMNSMKAIENTFLYSKYFMKKWQKSLLKKQIIYPECFTDNTHLSIKSLDQLTQKLIIEHSEYNSIEEYFNGYKITESVIDKLQIPCHVITAWDDPVIPFKDFLILEKKKNIKLVTTKHGGHCGFITSWKLTSWVEQYIQENS